MELDSHEVAQIMVNDKGEPKGKKKSRMWGLINKGKVGYHHK